MRKNYSTPAVMTRPARASQKSDSPDPEEKKVDYTGLDLRAEIERIVDEELNWNGYIKASHKWHCRCPFNNSAIQDNRCTSLNDAFILWSERSVLEDGQAQFTCTKCRRSGDLISFYRQYREATTGVKPDWKEAATFLHIDHRSWRVMEIDPDTGEYRTHNNSESNEHRRKEGEERHKRALAEITKLDAEYNRARAVLALGYLPMKDGRQIELSFVRSYLQERGFTLEQAAKLGMAYLPSKEEIGSDHGADLGDWRKRILFPLSGPKKSSGYAGRTLKGWKPGMSAEDHKKVLDDWNKANKGKQIPRTRKTQVGSVFYGYDLACSCSTLVIVEGEFDAASVRLALDGIEDIAVCAFGKSFQARQVPLNVLHVVLALDADQAGQQAIGRQMDELEARGLLISVAGPRVGKDWNDCLVQAGQDVSREEILAALRYTKVLLSPAEDVPSLIVRDPGIVEPVGYERGDICLLCGQQVRDEEGAFEVDTEGDLYCIGCWKRQTKHTESEISTQNVELSASMPRDSEQALALIRSVFDQEHWPAPYDLHLLPTGTSIDDLEQRHQEALTDGATTINSTSGTYQQSEQQESHRCIKHGKFLQYSDGLGGLYCDHVDCWARYRLIRDGAKRGYPVLIAVIDPRDYLPDLTKPPMYIKPDGTAIYPIRPVIHQQIFDAGPDAWRVYVAESCYQDIDRAIKALRSA